MNAIETHRRSNQYKSINSVVIKPTFIIIYVKKHPQNKSIDLVNIQKVATFRFDNCSLPHNRVKHNISHLAPSSSSRDINLILHVI